MHKLLTTISAFTLFASAVVSADVNDAQMRNLENRVSALEQRKTANGMVNPSGRPEVKDGADVFFTGDFLIWQAHENGLGYVIKSKGPNVTDAVTKEMHFKYDPGFRVGFGWNTPHDGWDLYANWTCFTSNASGHKNNHGGVMYPVLFNQVFSTQFNNSSPSSAKAHFNLHLNMIDLELGREFFVSKWLTLRPFIGMTTAWINQRMHAEYKGFQTTSNNFVSYVNHMKNKYWGIGVRPGLNTQWGLGSGFSFYGNTALSLLYGYFQLDGHQYTKNTFGPVANYVDIEHSPRVGRAIAEMQLGIRWEHMLANDHVHFSMQAGWENLMFFEQNQFESLLAGREGNAFKGSVVSNQGDLTIQGYTISLRLDF